MSIIEDIAKELARIKRQLRNSALFVGGAIETSSVVLPEWLIVQALRVEVNQQAWLYAWYQQRSTMTNGNAEPPTEIMGIRVYAIPERYGELPAPGWRIIDPFNRPRSRDPMFKALDQVTKEKTP